MPPEGSESAIVVRVPVPLAIERLRRRWDRAAGIGVPAHVTIVYPFVPPVELDPGVRRILAELAAEHEPFDVRFDRVGRFPTAVYAAPNPPTPFLRLTEAVAARFPAYPPYGGAFDEVIPHLTIAESAEASFDDIAAQTEAVMPFGHRVSGLDVLVQGPDHRWRSRWRVPLGRRSEAG